MDRLDQIISEFQNNEEEVLALLVELKQRRESDISEMVKSVHQNAKEHGWWEEERLFGEIIALCHSELSEALEEHRNNRKPNEIYYRDSKNGATATWKSENFNKPEGVPIELADVIIRIFDYCGHANIDIKSAIVEKMQYNKGRPYKHGGKVI